MRHRAYLRMYARFKRAVRRTKVHDKLNPMQAAAVDYAHSVIQNDDYDMRYCPYSGDIIVTAGIGMMLMRYERLYIYGKGYCYTAHIPNAAFEKLRKDAEHRISRRMEKMHDRAIEHTAAGIGTILAGLDTSSKNI